MRQTDGQEGGYDKLYRGVNKLFSPVSPGTFSGDPGNFFLYMLSESETILPSIHIKAILRDLLISVPSMYILPNKVPVVYINQYNFVW